MAESMVIYPVLAGLGKPIFPDFALNGAKAPYVVYTEAGGSPLNTLKGAPTLKNHLIQVEFWDKKPEDAAELAASATSALLAERMDVGSPPGRFTARQVGERSGFDEDTKLYVAIREYSVWTR